MKRNVQLAAYGKRWPMGLIKSSSSLLPPRAGEWEHRGVAVQHEVQTIAYPAPGSQARRAMESIPPVVCLSGQPVICLGKLLPGLAHLALSSWRLTSR